MTPAEILRLRLSNQLLLGSRLSDPQAVVGHLGAVQSQDYPAALWAVAQRLTTSSKATLQRAFDEAKIVRTHVLRPTWHFVAPQDIRWMLSLTAPRITASMTSRERQLGLDQRLAERSNAIIAGVLRGGNTRTRKELGEALSGDGIDISDLGLLSHLITRAELDALICSGPLRGTQVTWALLDERVPPTPPRSRDDAVAELVLRYFSSHGPATLRDFAWWSGLTITDGRRGLEAHDRRFASEKVDGMVYWYAPPPATAVIDDGRAFLLANYDEYTVAYRERQLFYPRAVNWQLGPRDEVPFSNVLVLGGVIVGLWKRTASIKDRLSLQLRWFNNPGRAQVAAADDAAQRYAAFLELPLELSTVLD